MLQRLAQNVNVKIEKSKDFVDLLEIISSVKFLDLAVFTNNTRDEWQRELLLSSIFENLKVFQIDQIHFYTFWFKVEQKFMYHKSCKILKTIQRCNFVSFAQLVELVLMMPELAFEEITRMLSVYGPEPYEAFKQEWCMKKVQAYASNKNGINRNYLIKLVEKLCSSFDVNVIHKLMC
jgi:hypothetical protein